MLSCDSEIVRLVGEAERMAWPEEDREPRSACIEDLRSEKDSLQRSQDIFGEVFT